MRFPLVTAAFLLPFTASAAPLDPGLLRLIPADARSVFGIDIQRYQHSSMASLYPLALTGTDDALSENAVQQMSQWIVAGTEPQTGRSPLTIVTDAVGTLAPKSSSPDAVPRFAFVRIDAATAIFGDSASVRQALSQRTERPDQAGKLAAQVGQLSETYDNWFILIRPLGSVEPPSRTATNLKYAGSFSSLIQEISGGIRLGGIDRVQVDIEMQSDKDAAALAALGRWLPGFIQMQDPNSLESALVDLADNMSVLASGDTVSLSFSLDENKLEDLVRARDAKQKRWREGAHAGE